MGRAYFDAIEALFSELIVTVKSDFTSSECCEVQDYIDVGEYGLALSTCVAIYAEEGKMAGERVRFLLTCLAEKMSKDPKAILAKLN